MFFNIACFSFYWELHFFLNVTKCYGNVVFYILFFIGSNTGLTEDGLPIKVVLVNQLFKAPQSMYVVCIFWTNIRGLRRNSDKNR